ncbi:Hypothetical protein FKW44_007742 [Caligus rogercresseyi]|uniref:Uncharacterized protein n=1 Tax=Caligus rogercresseyi TaxID=217165 RepID=A0A7T8KF86_CALRO|nr:Hypothetical protein FKW44_007742 [Caligus rogercresseyi]
MAYYEGFLRPIQHPEFRGGDLEDSSAHPHPRVPWSNLEDSFGPSSIREFRGGDLEDSFGPSSIQEFRGGDLEDSFGPSSIREFRGGDLEDSFGPSSIQEFRGGDLEDSFGPPASESSVEATKGFLRPIQHPEFREAT